MGQCYEKNKKHIYNYYARHHDKILIYRRKFSKANYAYHKACREMRNILLDEYVFGEASQFLIRL
jgi:hypothetical protein